jgi:hypothetical protein
MGGWNISMSGPRAEVIAAIGERELDEESPSREQFAAVKTCVIAELAAGAGDGFVTVSCYGRVEANGRRFLNISIG